MTLMRFGSLVIAGCVAFSSVQSADAGCNCNVPPAPAPMTSSVGNWSAPGAQYLAPDGQPGLFYGNAVGQPNYGYGGYGNPAGVAGGGTWAPGGYEPRIGSPVYYHDPAGGQYQVTGNPYDDHFGPGFHRNSLHGHYRFPYYNYRAPWYFPGRAVYNRDTNFPW